MHSQLSCIQTALSNVQNLSIKPILKPFHIACLNHRINHDLIHVFKRVAHLSSIQPKLITFAFNSSTRAYQSVIHKHYPKFIHTAGLHYGFAELTNDVYGQELVLVKLLLCSGKEGCCVLNAPSVVIRFLHWSVELPFYAVDVG